MGSFNIAEDFLTGLPLGSLFGSHKHGTPTVVNPATAELSAELKNYQTVAPTAQAGVLQDSQRAGTYSNTPQAEAQREAESNAETKFGQEASFNRINSLRQSLGMQALAPGQDPNNTPGTPSQSSSIAPTPAPTLRK